VGRAALVLALGLSTAAYAAASGSQTKLSIAVYPKGVGAGIVRHYTLACAPARGTVPHPGKACLALARLSAPFAPVPPDEICTQIALGPQEAIVSGTVAGRHVYARLRLNDGCQIDRWRHVSAIVPGFPA
jgi:hypothetical protein